MADDTPDPAAVDARVLAAQLLRTVQQRGNGAHCMAYGTARQVLLGIGCDSDLVLNQPTSLNDLWSRIDHTIDYWRGQYIFGFIGFDPSNLLRRPTMVPQRKIGLFIPETVLRVDGAGFKVLKGAWTFGTPIADTPKHQPLDPQNLDSQVSRAHYHAAVKDLLGAIGRGDLERATLARRIDTTLKFDLVYTFLSDRSEHRQSRNFYFSNGHIRFAGQSPELLAEGNASEFSTHKLSGTWQRDNDRDTDEQINAFRSDPRIRAEHESSTITIEKSLSEIGHCRRSPARVMTLPTLLHGWSEFTTLPIKPAAIADCLRAVFPFGVQPLDAGMAAIAMHEKDCRGPYYGVAGVIEPGGEFSFTQVVRTAFEDERGCYLMTGAAITPNSTPELETAETCNKLSGIGLATSPAD